MSKAISKTANQESKLPIRSATSKHPFFTLGDEIDRIFTDFGMPTTQFSLPNVGFNFVPSVEINELKTRIIVKVEIPGVDPEDVKIEVKGDSLKLSGEKHVDEEHEEGGKTISEHNYGSFYRSISLSSEVVTAKVTANAKDGVIKITLPRAKPSKHEEDKALKIPINTSKQTS